MCREVSRDTSTAVAGSLDRGARSTHLGRRRILEAERVPQGSRREGEWTLQGSIRGGQLQLSVFAVAVRV